MMDEIKTKQPEKRRGGFGFKRTAALVCMVAVLGGGTLGVGVGVGLTVTRRLMPQTENTVETQPAFSFTGTQTPIIPINVQVNDFTGIVKTVSESVVSINVTATVNMYGSSRESEGAGSGFLFAEDDTKIYVATNNHVVEGVDTISVSLDDNENVAAKLVGRDSQSDLAVLSVLKSELDALGVPYHIATLGDSTKIQVGDRVVAIGNSMGEGKIATSGIISAVNRQITIEKKQLDVIQTDAAINMGNSGGPLVNDQGEVIGINTAKLYYTGVEGMGYSIPINQAQDILETLQVDGSVEKPYLGVLRPFTVNQETKDAYNLPSTGVLVIEVAEDGPAEKAGLEAKDLIMGYNGESVTGVEDLQRMLAASKVGDQVTVSLYRGEEQMEFTVTLGNANE